MGRRRLASLVFGPICLFVAVMAFVAAFVAHPPALGWVGLGVLATALICVGVVLYRVFLRTRTNEPRRHPHESGLYRLLVVVDAEIEPDDLCSAVRLRTLGRRSEVHVVAPIIPSSMLHFVVDDEDDERREAERRLQIALRSLNGAGIAAKGAVGSDDPLQAAGDELAGFPADEVLLVAPLASRRTWLNQRAEQQLRDLFGVPVSTSFGKRELSWLSNG